MPHSNKILLIGSGRLALHFHHYFKKLGLEFSTWSRKENSASELPAKLNASEVVLLLISDDAIPDFIKQHPDILTKKAIHCSGALQVEGLKSTHPLMTFGSELYEDKVYPTIPFAIFEKDSSLEDLILGLPNPYFFIPAKQKALYHALCVLMGNVPQIIWKKVLDEFRKLDLPEAVWQPFLQGVLANFIKNPNLALTGPISRGDEKIIAKNLESLSDSVELKKLYELALQIHKS